MGKWKFVPGEFNGKGEYQQLGSIETPEGLWFAAVERNGAFNQPDESLIQAVIKVLNREMPNGRIRKHQKRGKK